MKHSYLTGIIVIALGLAGCARTSVPDDAPAARVTGNKIIFPATAPQLAKIVTVGVKPATGKKLQLTGRLVWNEDATVRVFSTFEGRVTRIIAPLGQSVKKDEPLAAIASPDFGQVQADAAKASLDLQLAERTLSRLRELTSSGATAEKELRAAEVDFAHAQRESLRATQRLKIYGGSLGASDQEFALRSPIAGVVVERNINPGQSVRPDQLTANAPPLFTVTDPTRLWVILDATEADLPALRVGSVVSLRSPAYATDRFEAVIDSVADAVDPVSRTIKVRGALSNPARKLKAEMFVSGDLLLPAVSGFEVPANAVFLKGDRHYVFTATGKGQFELVEVKINDEQEGKIVVTSGLNASDSVVAGGGIILDQMINDRGSN